MIIYVYPDAYLARFCNQDREDRALADVAVMAGSRTFSADYIERLTILQAYVISCLENQAADDDLFTTKLKTYREQLQLVLSQAILDADATAETTGGFSLFAVPLERG
jgi:hypothetical protein